MPTASSRAPSAVKNEGGQEQRELEDCQADRDTAEPLASEIGSKLSLSSAKTAAARAARAGGRPSRRVGLERASAPPGRCHGPSSPPGDEELRRGEPGRPQTQPALLTSTGLIFPTWRLNSNYHGVMRRRTLVVFVSQDPRCMAKVSDSTDF